MYKMGVDPIEKRVDRVEKEVTIGFEQIRNELRNFQSRVEEMRSEMSHVTSKVDTIIGYSRSKSLHETPNRPYFTLKDVTVLQNVRARLFSGKAVRLHLMCEARHQPHFVEDQEGLELVLEKGGNFSKYMRTLSVLSIKMIWVLLKVGAQVTAGLGAAVPDISNLATGLPIAVGSAGANLALDTLQLEVSNNLSWVEDSRSVEEAWFCFRDHLHATLTRDSFANLFKLHKVTYRGSPDPCAWICESCVAHGRRNFLLE